MSNSPNTSGLRVLKCPCGSFDENVLLSHSVRHLKALYLVGAVDWGDLGGVALWEDVRH